MFGYKQKGLDMKEFYEKDFLFDEKMDDLDDLYINAFYKIKLAIFKKKCNQIEDYISSLPDDIREKIKNTVL